MTIRVQESELMSDTVRALGAIPVPMIYGEVYSGLQTGKVDGAENNWPSYESTGHYEVAKYFTVDEHSRVPEVQIASSYTWNRSRKNTERSSGNVHGNLLNTKEVSGRRENPFPDSV